MTQLIRWVHWTLLHWQKQWNGKVSFFGIIYTHNLQPRSFLKMSFLGRYNFVIIMVFPVFPNHMTTAMTSQQLASFWILPQVNNVAAYRINFILDQTQWVACLLMVSESGLRIQCLQRNYFEVDILEHL